MMIRARRAKRIPRVMFVKTPLAGKVLSLFSKNPGTSPPVVSRVRTHVYIYVESNYIYISGNFIRLGCESQGIWGEIVRFSLRSKRQGPGLSARGRKRRAGYRSQVCPAFVAATGKRRDNTEYRSKIGLKIGKKGGETTGNARENNHYSSPSFPSFPFVSLPLREMLNL
jgi:hypothetical protein